MSVPETCHIDDSYIWHIVNVWRLRYNAESTWPMIQYSELFHGYDQSSGISHSKVGWIGAENIRDRHTLSLRIYIYICSIIRDNVT